MPREITTTDASHSVASHGREFLAGLTATWHGFRYMCRNASLWRYGVIPIALNLLINAALLLGLIGMTMAFTGWFHARFQEMEYGAALEVLAFVGLIILALGVALAAWKLLEGIFCGYFYGKLAVAMELQLGLPIDQIRDISFRSQLIDAVRGFVLLLTINLGCLLLNCVPVIGSIAAIVIALYCDALILGRNYFDYPLSIRGWQDQAKRHYSQRHRGAILGLGSVAFVFNLLPIFGAVVLTTATSGAVLLHRKLTESDRT